MEGNWSEISEQLFSVYDDNMVSDKFFSDEKYLKEAFVFTERLWNKNFNEIDGIKVIMIAEAPLFGIKKTYIYNSKTSPTAFFYFKDLEAFPSYKDEKAKSPEEKKEIMFKNFIKSGFLVLNIFPFAFNTEDTALNYQRMNKATYLKLLKITEKSYLIPKLEKCFKKGSKKISFVYRYKRLFEKTEFHFENVLKRSFKNINYTIDSVHGENMTLNREKLAVLFKQKS